MGLIITGRPMEIRPVIFLEKCSKRGGERWNFAFFCGSLGTSSVNLTLIASILVLMLLRS
ncbi:hypothetical protein BDZ94DRAFT_1254323 [Collybia nuda]|uniref:Uncharacterized protein n=1 Tax=Collybia nuda TaxID=64659 RepID=A0A9P6CLW7_9AGAR|nr:hypothetical protein BDZ94DRAFT_1254323 [Collybia nuda]